MASLLQNEKACYITGRTDGLHKHHIFKGANRKISEEQGFYVWLVPEFHNMSKEGVHFNHAFDLTLKRLCQFAYEVRLVLGQGISQDKARDRFIKIIGRNYL